MVNEFKDLKINVNELLASLTAIRQNYDKYGAVVIRELDDLTRMVNTLLEGPLATSQVWENVPKQVQTDVIKSIKKELPVRIKIIKDSIEQLSNELVIGRKKAIWVTCCGIALLLILMGVYIWLHTYIQGPTYIKKHAENFFISIGNAEASIEIINPGQSGEIIPIKLDFEKNNSLTLKFAERVSILNGNISILNKSCGTNTSRNQIVSKVKEEIEKIKKDAIRMSENDGFFWIVDFWRWLEIVFWGEFGVIVGVLSWVCLQVVEAKYTKEVYGKEISWYIAEIVIGPIVVVAAFFLIRQFIGTLITGITEDEIGGSIYLTLGVSFTLGLFIRRTLGVFDYVKKSLPLPKEKKDK